MTPQETMQLLHLFRGYWPTFETAPNDGDFPGTVRIWAEALAEYHLDDVRRALLNFRSEKGRTFAPTMSEFEGLTRDFHSERLRKPHIGSDDGAEQTESYELNGRWYIRMTRKRSAELHKEMIAEGFYRQDYALPNGRTGYRYCKIEHSPAKPARPTPYADAFRPVLDERHDWTSTFSKLDEATRTK